MSHGKSRLLAAWAVSGLVALAATTLAMRREVTTFGKPESIQTGLDFSNNTWRAVRDLLAGKNIYAPTHELIPGIGPAWPVSQHVPASLLWQAPVAALALPAALFTFTFLSILAIWAGVFVLLRPKGPAAIFVASWCGAFAICIGGGPMTLLLGQPTGFILLGLAIVVRARQPWLAGIGLLLAASTFQNLIPLTLALLIIGRWPVVWRGAVLILGCSLPPVSLEIANAGLGGFVGSFVPGAGVHFERLTNRIDIGGLLLRLGVTSVGVQIAAGLLVATLALGFLAWLPKERRRIDDPPVLCLVISFMLVCTYHQLYDVLLIGGVVAPVILVIDRSRAMLPAFAIAGIAAVLSATQLGLVVDPIAILVIGVSSALVARRAAMRASTPVADGSAGDGNVSAVGVSAAGASAAGVGAAGPYGDGALSPG